MSLQEVGFAFLILGVFLLLGKLIRVRSKAVQRLFLPSSILAGFLVLLSGPQVFGRIVGGSFEETGLFTLPMLDAWSSLPGVLITVVFATLFLGMKLPSFKRAAKLTGPQVSLGVALGSGQYVVGILLALLVLVPFFDSEPVVGALIEIGFEGGHGTAAGMSESFENIGFPAGGDLAIGIATVGIVSGIIIGIFLINWAVRKGHTEVVSESAEMSIEEQRGLFRDDEHYPAGEQTTRSASIDALSLHMAIVFVSVLVGWLLLEGLRWVEANTYAAQPDSFELFAHVPLFPLALLGGVFVQWVSQTIGVDNLIDHDMMLRIQGFALDFLIVAAIGTLSLQAIGENLGSFLLLSVAGIVFCVSMLLWFGPKVIGRYWFERGIGDFGQSMGVTATGLILMRIVDPDAQSPAFEAFGYKQLVFEPFFGGGLITAAAVPVIHEFGPWPFLAAMAAIFVVAVVGGLWMFGGDAKREHEERAAERVKV